MTNQVLTITPIRQNKGINNELSLLYKVFGRLTSSNEVALSTTNQVMTTTFIRKKKKVLTMALVHRRKYLVIRHPHMKLYCR